MRDRSKRYVWISRVLGLGLVFSIGINIVGMAYVTKIGAAEKTLEETVASSEEIVFTKETLESYMSSEYERKLEKLLTPSEMKIVAQRQWECILSANGKEFVGNTVYVDQSSNVRVLLAEVAKDSSILPESLLLSGSIGQGDKQDSLDNHIQIYSPIPYEIVQEKENGNIKYYYEFKDVAPNTIITIEISDILKAKLKNKEQIKDNRVEVIVR